MRARDFRVPGSLCKFRIPGAYSRFRVSGVYRAISGRGSNGRATLCGSVTRVLCSGSRVSGLDSGSSRVQKLGMYRTVSSGAAPGSRSNGRATCLCGSVPCRAEAAGRIHVQLVEGLGFRVSSAGRASVSGAEDFGVQGSYDTACVAVSHAGQKPPEGSTCNWIKASGLAFRVQV